MTRPQLDTDQLPIVTDEVPGDSSLHDIHDDPSFAVIMLLQASGQAGS